MFKNLHLTVEALGWQSVELIVLRNSWHIINNGPCKVFSYFSLSTLFLDLSVLFCVYTVCSFKIMLNIP